MSAFSAMVKMPLCVTESFPFVVTCFCRVTAFPVMEMSLTAEIAPPKSIVSPFVRSDLCVVTSLANVKMFPVSEIAPLAVTVSKNAEVLEPAVWVSWAQLIVLSNSTSFADAIVKSVLYIAPVNFTVPADSMMMSPIIESSEPTAPYTVMFPVPPVSDKVFSSPETAPSVIDAPVSFPSAPFVWMVELPVSVSVFISASEERTTGAESVMIFPLSVVFPCVCVIPPLKVNVSSVLLPSVSVPVVPNVTGGVTSETSVAALNVMSKLMTDESVVVLSIVTAVTSLLNVTAPAVSAVFFISIVAAFMGMLKIASAFVLINVSVFAMSFPFAVPSAVNLPTLVCIDVLLNVVAFANLRVCPVAELNTTVPPFAVNVVYEKSASEEKYVLPEDAVRIAGVASVAVELLYVPRKVIVPVEPLIFPSFVTFPLNVTAPLLPVIVPPAKTVTAPLYDCVPAVTAPPS